MFPRATGCELVLRRPTDLLSFASMATSAPLLGKEGKAAHSKASIFYGADEYLEELKKKIRARP